MKYLNDYTEEATSKILKNNGAFFAFSDKQLDEAKKDGVKYISLGAGLIAPEQNAKKLINELEKIVKIGINQDIKENGKENIIKRELSNHEAYYTGDIFDTKEKLKGYNITDKAILKVFNQERINQNENI